MGNNRQKDSGDGNLGCLLFFIAGLIILVLAILNVLLPILLGGGIFYFLYQYLHAMKSFRQLEKRYLLPEDLLFRVTKLAEYIAINDRKIALLEQQLSMDEHAARQPYAQSMIQARILHLKEINVKLREFVASVYSQRTACARDMRNKFSLFVAFATGLPAYFLTALYFSHMHGIPASYIIPLLDLNEFTFMAIFGGDSLTPGFLTWFVTAFIMTCAFFLAYLGFAMLHLREVKIDPASLKVDLDSTESEDFRFDGGDTASEHDTRQEQEEAQHENRSSNRNRQEEHMRNQDPPNRYEAALAILELDNNCVLTADLLKQQYYRLVAQYHPDKVAHLGKELKELAEEKTKRINEAYEYLMQYVQQ
ncbi:MAG: J domain-containing protein [Spirochaetaceae bacterium]|nr:J domain-containing protein [Spirochaetaceae bacterium]